MTMEYRYRELDVDEEPPEEAARVIIEQMGIDLPLGSLEALLRRTRHTYRMALGDWLRRNDPAWRAPRRLPRRSSDGYDYGDMAGVGLPDWDEWWNEIWGREQGNPRLFRGTDVATPPLVSIYFMVNRWWRNTTGLSFNPNFGAQYSADTDAARFPDLKPDAQIFLLVAQDSGGRLYDCNLCGRVHDAYYRQLDRSFPEPG